MEVISIKMKKISEARLYVYSLLKFLGGASLLGIGCAFFIHADVGADPLSCFALGLQLQFSLHVEYGILFISIGMMAITCIFNRHQIGIGSLLYPFVSSSLIYITRMCLPNINSLWLRYVCVFIGILCMAISIAICANQMCGDNPYDGLAFTFMHKWKCSYTRVRYILDAIFLMCGILLGNMFGIGTILILVFLGLCAQGCMQIKKRLSIIKV